METIILAQLFTLPVLLAGMAAFLVGGALSYFFWNMALGKKKEKIIREAEAESEVIKKDKILQAKEKFLQLKSEHEKYINEKNSKIGFTESKLRQKESMLSQKWEETQRAKNEVETIRENLNSQLSLVERKKRGD